LICTPGRLVEHLKSTPGFTLDYLKWLVIDEADKLLDQSFQQWLPNLLRMLPKDNGNRFDPNRVTKVILSATVSRDVGQLNELQLYRPALVVLEGSEAGNARSDEALSLPATLHESAVKVASDGDKPLYLLHLLKSGIPEGSGFLVFTKSNEAAVRLARLISLLNPDLLSGTLTSTIPHSTRKATLASFRTGRISVLFASDLVSRGLDLPDRKSWKGGVCMYTFYKHR